MTDMQNLFTQLHATTRAVIRQVKRFDATNPHIKAMDVPQRIALVDKHLLAFRDMLMNAAFEEGSQPRFFHFSLGLDSFIDIVEKQDGKLLDCQLKTTGYFVPPFIYHHLTENIFQEKVQQAMAAGNQTVLLLGSVEIMVTADGDVKRVFFQIGKRDDTHQKELKNIITTAFAAQPHSESMTDQMVDFLQRPEAHPDVLVQVLDQIKQSDPVLAEFARKELDNHAQNRCAGCTVLLNKPSHCGNCKQVVYCGRECQTRHWKSHHKYVCQKK